MQKYMSFVSIYTLLFQAVFFSINALTTADVPDQIILGNDHDSSEIRRPIPWGQLNVIHTTDTHGWLAGHSLEPMFSADWGDFISFSSHIQKQAEDRGADVLLIDSGDRHDGNGLSDATTPGGEVSQRFFMLADYDIVTVGNHELYKAEIATQEYELLRPHFGDKYLSSNIDYRLDDGTWVPMGSKYRVFHTKNNNFKVLSMGFLFNFAGNADNTRVKRVQKVVHEQWFEDALKTPDLDVIVLATHIPVRFFSEFDVLIQAIRQVLPDIPIQGLGGHVHIRDYRVFDEKAVALGSGRFMETLGWASANITDPQNVGLDRLYIDFNKEGLSYHTDTSLETGTKESFDTDEGLEVSQSLRDWRTRLNLTQVIACVPQNYYTARAKYPSSNSLFTLLEDKVLPSLESSTGREIKPRFILVNSGSIRFDLFKGPYTKDTGYLVSPFTNDWVYLENVPIREAKQILPLLNQRDHIILTDSGNTVRDFSELGMASCIGEHGGHDSIALDIPDGKSVMSVESMGYVTYDDLGHLGDDTAHKPWNVYHSPNVIQCKQNIDDSTEFADVIYYDFIQPFVDDVLATLGMEKLQGQAKKYGGSRIIELLPKYFAKSNNSTC